MAPTRALAERFGENLLRCRERAGISQEALGFNAELHRTEIGMLERGIRLPRIDTLLKLAGALEAEPADLLAGMGWSAGAATPGRFRLDGNDAGGAR